MRVFLVRHGQSEWNASRRLQGQADIELSDQGRREADALRDTIAAIKPCRTITSDLKRVKETAARISADVARPEPRLREIDVGAWTGRAIDELAADLPKDYAGWRAGHYTPPQGETWSQFVARVVAALEDEIRAPCDNLLVVCHGGVIRAVLEHYLGLAPRNIIPVAPASLTAFRLANGTKPARLELFNYRSISLEFEAPD